MRRKIKNRNIVTPDHLYTNKQVAQFINYVMKDGKKNTARAVVYKAFDDLKETHKKNPVEVFETALKNTAPTMEVRSRRIGGANYQVPREVRPERKNALAMRWILDAARSRKGMPMHKRLIAELLAAANNEGEAVRKRENTHKMAEANRAFAHFSW